MSYLTADVRDCLANARDAQLDADTMRRQAAKARQPRRGEFLVLAEKFDLESASWLVHSRNAMEG